MFRRYGSLAKKRQFSAQTTIFVLAMGLGISVLAGCSGKDDNKDAGGMATGVEDNSRPPAVGDRGYQPSPGPAANPLSSSVDDGSVDFPGREPSRDSDFPSGDSHFPITPASIDASAAAGERADGLGSPELPEGFALRRPSVVLSAGHEALCRVRVGDAMPSFTLPDIAGQPKSLPELLGRRLTVVVFWTLQHPYASEQFERLGADVVGPYAEFGVNVVAINVGDAPELVRAGGDGVAAAFPILLDEDGKKFDLVATEKLPRTYLLDPVGRILWFDIEYSESTRRDLENAILWHQIKEPTIATR